MYSLFEVYKFFLEVVFHKIPYGESFYLLDNIIYFKFSIIIYLLNLFFIT